MSILDKPVYNDLSLNLTSFEKQGTSGTNEHMLHFREFSSFHRENEPVTVLAAATSGSKSSAQHVSMMLQPRPSDTRRPQACISLDLSSSIVRLERLSLQGDRESCSVKPDSLRPHGLYSPWNSSGHNTGVGSFSHLQGIFPTQGSNPGLLQCRWILFQLSRLLYHKTTKKIFFNSKKTTFLRLQHLNTCIV